MRNRQLRFVQRGGQGNSLGRIVFRFANSFSVYLHDTNSPGAFHRDRRAVSHGCVRVERPFDLALFLLPDLDEWSIDRLRISMDLSPLTYRGMEWLSNHADSPRPYRLFTYHKVSPPVPVHLIYYTMYPNPMTGIMETHPDIYGYDQPLLRQLQRLLE
jgi:murein L,D-transpeptidase YcbB/YkuD